MSQANPRQSRTKGLVVAAFIFVIALIAWGATQSLGANNGQERLFALVHDSDGNVTALALDHNTEQTITTKLGSNTVVVKDGSASVSDADCDNQDCVHQGSIASSDRQIICLPHKLWIEVVSANDAATAEKSGTAQDEDKADSFDTTSR